MDENIIKKYFKDYDSLDKDTKYKICNQILNDLHQNNKLNDKKKCVNCNKSIIKKDNLCSDCLINNCIHCDKKYKYLLFTRKTLDGLKFCTYCTKFFQTKSCELSHLCFEKNTHILQSYDRMYIDKCEDCSEKYLMCGECAKRICNCGVCSNVCMCEYRYKK